MLARLGKEKTDKTGQLSWMLDNSSDQVRVQQALTVQGRDGGGGVTGPSPEDSWSTCPR